MNGRLERSGLLRVFARLLFIQATLHRKGMQNIGVLHALSGAAPKLSDDPTALLARHTDHFNTNPNAAPVVIGGVLRIEEERSTGAPASLARFKQAACSALAALGDVPADQLWFRISGFGSDATPMGLRRYIAAVMDFQRLGLPIVADAVGGLVGAAIAAFGAAGGICKDRPASCTSLRKIGSPALTNRSVTLP